MCQKYNGDVENFMSHAISKTPPPTSMENIGYMGVILLYVSLQSACEV